MSADQRGGRFGAALDRVGAELNERRTPVAVALAAVALLMTYRGLHQPTHSYAAVGVAMLLVVRAVALGRAFLGRHLAGSVALLVAAHTADTGEHALVAWTAVAAAGAGARLPPPATGARRRRRPPSRLGTGRQHLSRHPRAVRPAHGQELCVQPRPTGRGRLPRPARHGGRVR